MKERFDLKIRDHLLVPERKKLYNERHFSEAAPRYDFATRAMSLGRDAAWKRCLVGALPAWPSPSCADLACGTGDVTFLLHRNPEIHGYIAASLETFPDRAHLRKLLFESGFDLTRSRLFYLGILELIVLRKRMDPQRRGAAPVPGS